MWLFFILTLDHIYNGFGEQVRLRDVRGLRAHDSQQMEKEIVRPVRVTNLRHTYSADRVL